jgi:hypothetical protein
VSANGFFVVYLTGECHGIADGYRVLFAEIGRTKVKLLDPCTLDTGTMERRTFERRAQAADVRKTVMRSCIRRALQLRERTKLVKTCLTALRAA